MRTADRVLITGIGLRTALGKSRETTWAAIRSGRTAARFLDPGDSAYGVYAWPGSATPACVHMVAVVKEAIRDAKICPRRDPPLDRHRIGTVVGFSKGDVGALAEAARTNRFGASGDAISPGAWTGLWPNGLASHFARSWDLRGPCLAPIAACATGLIAMIQGADLIRRNLCDVVVVGAGDSPLEPMVLGAFRKMRAFARVADDPTRAVRPWDRERSGFLPGEGGAILVLERESHARGRGITSYAEFAGGAFGSDAHHITDLNPDPAGLSHWIDQALRISEASTSDVDHINVHGTATRQNDPLECRAIRRVFGSHADSISCSANKAQIGHMLGAAGAAELAITCLAIRDGFVPPTLNLDHPDPACDLDGTPHVGKLRQIRSAMKISIGFGGHLAAAVLRQPEGGRRSPELFADSASSS